MTLKFSANSNPEIFRVENCSALLIRRGSVTQWLPVRLGLIAMLLGISNVAYLSAALSPSYFQQQVDSAGEDDLFKRLDRNKDGFIDRGEWPRALTPAVIQSIDKDRDGKISRAEHRLFQSERNSPASRRNAKRLPEGTNVKENLVYATVEKRALPLDLYLPKSDEPTPLIFWVHGGGWQSGSKEPGGPGLFQLLERGYAVASVEYRLSGEAIFPAAIEDCKAAVSFLRLHASKYNLDPQRFGAWGASAGGHLVALMGTTGDTSEFNTHPVTQSASSQLQAVCNWFGPSDFLRMNDFPSVIDHDSPDSPESRFIGAPIQKVPQNTELANPGRYASAQDPPFLHMHGDKDRLVPFNQSEILHKTLRKAGVETTLYKVVNGGHGFGGSNDTAKKLIEKSIRFFDRHLPRQKR